MKDGVKTTETVQLADAASVARQVLLEITKSPGFVPVMLMSEILSVALPLFVKVVVRTADGEETGVPVKVSDVGLKLVPACVPVLLKATC